MELQNQIKCDVCGIEKQPEANGWFSAVIIPRTEEAPDDFAIAYGPLGSEEGVERPHGKKEHYCGRACSVQRFSQWLDTEA